MGGLVEQQLITALRALTEGEINLAESVIDNESLVNSYEVRIDDECTRILARRRRPVSSHKSPSGGGQDHY